VSLFTLANYREKDSTLLGECDEGQGAIAESNGANDRIVLIFASSNAVMVNRKLHKQWAGDRASGHPLLSVVAGSLSAFKP